MIDDNPSSADPFGQIADEFVEAFRQGKRPSIEEFARRYPAHADEIREMLPALVLMEKARAPDLTAGEGANATAPAAAPPLRQLGDYQILREVGRGGMGVVYEAQQLSLGRHVAIKVLRSHALQDARHLARFQREARSAAKLHHTNIVPVFGVGEQDGLHYYVMQFIQGLGLDVVLDELRRLLQPRGKLAPTSGDAQARTTNDNRDVAAVAVARALLSGEFRRPESAGDFTIAPAGYATEADLGASAPVRPADTSATVDLRDQKESSTLSESGSKYWQSVARVGIQLAEAMAHAANQGVLHRDIKPSNLLLDDTGNVWVTDFGLAKAESDGDNLTHTGDIVGTLRYMAPERFHGHGDVRSDVYALGLTLYELLTLRPASEETDRNRLIKRVMHDEPARPRKFNPAVPRDLETVVLKAIDRDPARRYQAPGALADDLQRFLDGRPITARPVGRIERAVKWVKRNPVVTGAAAAVVLALAMGTGVSYLKYLDAEQQKQEAQKEAEKAKKARDFLVSIFRISETGAQGDNITARQILADAEKRIPEEFADQPELQADLVKTIGEVKRGIGRRTPQAMILEARGTVQLQSAAGAQKAAVPQALLRLDDRLTLSADAQVQVVFLSDFHKERLKPGREVTIDDKGCEPADALLGRDDSVLMTFVRLPKGAFYMGWDGRRTGVKTEIKDDFEIAVHDVTQGQWQAVMGNNPSWFSRKGKGRNEILDISDEELELFPVESVSWDDAQEFINKLNEKERGRGYLYRLPSEAEWEYACRGGATSQDECSYRFYLDKPTNDLSPEQANYNGNSSMWRAPDGMSLQRTTRVGAYPANKLGLCDMHGNVAQWCAEAFIPQSLVRVTRGGSWHHDIAYCTAANRGGVTPTDRRSDLGFRLVRVPVR
jgi:serine/threonine protein kinase/formylglycine-generating enzyme required for sulfatase activity